MKQRDRAKGEVHLVSSSHKLTLTSVRKEGIVLV